MTCAPRVESLTKYSQAEVDDDRDPNDEAAAVYTGEEIKQPIRELRMEAMEKPTREGSYAHGDLQCAACWFDDGIELNFIIDEIKGIEIGLAGTPFLTHQTSHGKCFALAREHFNAQ